MKRQLLLLILSLGCTSLLAQSWEELYKSTEDCWGKDWHTCSQILLQALEAAEKEHGKISQAYTSTIQDLGISLTNLREFDKALPYFKEGLELTGQFSGTDNARYTSSMASLGILYIEMDLYPLALPLMEEAVEKTILYLGKDHHQYEVRIDYLGFLYQAMGQFEKALPLLQEQVRICEKKWGPSHYSYAISLRSLGDLYLNMEYFEQALPLYEKALHIFETELGKEHHIYGNLLGNIGMLHSRAGRRKQAIPLLEKASEIIGSQHGKNHPNYARLLSYLGNIQYEEGNYSSAMPLLQQSIEITKQTQGIEHPHYGLALQYLAVLYFRMEQYDQALTTFHESLSNIGQYLGKEHAEYAFILLQMAGIYHQIDEGDTAFTYYEELFEVLRQQLNSQFFLLDDRTQTAFLRKKQRSFNQISSFAYARPSFSRMAEIQYDQQLLIKGFLQNNQAELLENLRQSSDSSIQGMFIKWNELHKKLADQYKLPPAHRMQQLDSLQFLADQLEVDLSNQSRIFRNSRQQVSWKEVQATLGPDEAAIEFNHFPYYNRDSTLYIAYLIRSTDDHPQMIPLFEEKELSSLLSSNQKDNTDQLYRGIKPRKAQSNDYTNLTTIIWQPLEPYLEGIKTLYLSPTSLLHKINIGAIPLNKQRYVSDRYQLVQLGSTRSLVVADDSSRQTSIQQILLLGGIHYGELEDNEPMIAQQESEEFDLDNFAIASRGQTDQWTYLAGTEKEATRIDELFSDKGIPSTLLTAKMASERYLKRMTSSPTVLHIATHGYFFPDPSHTSTVFSENPNELPSVQLSDHPMVRSGLILAGANHAWQGNPVPEGQEDGILTAYEISRMDLSNTELVVLSACETGLGDIQGNEGVYGLQRAFKIAGAKYILMSLWQVPDQATQELMTAFYEYWLDGMEIRMALQEAQKEIRKKYKEPYYWAGFVLVE